MSSTHKMKAIINTLKQTVCADRNETHGDPYEQFGMTAALWSIVFQREFTRSEVALAMQLSKISRERHGQPNPDDDLDNLGYGLIKAAMKEMEKSAAMEAAMKEMEATIKGMEEPDTISDTKTDKHPIFMRCRECQAVQQVEYGNRFVCQCCGGRYAALDRAVTLYGEPI